MINTTYAALMLGESLPEGHPYHRYWSTAPTDAQRRALRKVVPANLEQRAIFAEFVLKLLSCSPTWSSYVPAYDMQNTYNTEVLDEKARLDDDPLTRLCNWVSGSPGTDQLDPPLDQITEKLFMILRRAGSEYQS